MGTSLVRNYDYSAWYADAKQSGGAPLTWPFSSGLYAQYYGRPAARYSGRAYTDGVNVGAIAMNVPTQTDPSSTYVYVLAPQSAWAGAPHTMTTGESFLNSLFTAGDKAADAAGLPSLNGIENFLKSIGKDAALIGGVIVVGWYLLTRRGNHG